MSAKKAVATARTSKAALADVVEALINDKPEEGEIAIHEAIKLKSHAILHEMDDEEDMEDEPRMNGDDEEMEDGEDEEMEDEEGEDEECPSDEEGEDEEFPEDEEGEDDEEMSESAKHHMKHPKVKSVGIKHKSGFKPFKRVGKK